MSIFLGVLLILDAALAGPATGLPGQTTVGGAAPAPSVGWPAGDPFARDEAVLDRPLRHVARQIADFPVPGSPMPLPPPAQMARLEEARPKPFTVNYVFMPRSDVQGADEGVLYNEIGVDYLWARPLFSSCVFLFRPSFDVVFFSGPAPVPVLPGQVFKVAFDFQFDVPVNDTVGVSVGLTPGLWSDFVVLDGNDFRLPARALLTFRVNETLFLAAGVLYTDNIRRNLLPDFGVVWDPSNEWHVELLYPRSRVVYRFNESWNIYFVFERGGTTYNIRTLGEDEDMEYRDWRAMFGVEMSRWSAFDLFAEVGGAWDRKFRFDIQPTADVSDAFLLRVGVRF